MEKQSARLCFCSLFILVATMECVLAQAPSLSRTLLTNYTINPSFNPLFPYCKFSGNPTPSISWSYNGNDNLPSDETEGGPYYNRASGVLVLTNAQTGRYTCTGVNQFGSDSVNVTITIIPTPAAPWYLMPYMYFVYALVAWLVCTALIAILYCKKRRHNQIGLDDANELYCNIQEVLAEPPSEWQSQLSTAQVHPVAHATPEWNRIEQRFKSTMPISRVRSISRIQNTWLWGNYCLLKGKMKIQHKENVQELELFHGSRENNPKLIYERDETVDTKKSAVQVNYFTTDASYSDAYSYRNIDGYKEVVLFKVVIVNQSAEKTRGPPSNPAVQSTGHGFSEADPSMQLPESIYDDVVALQVTSSQVYMVQNPDQTYPAYLIKYS